MTGKLIVVSGAQFGSEAKGHVADQLTRPEYVGYSTSIVAVRVAGPNAGHTVYGVCPPSCDGTSNGHEFNGKTIGHPWRLRTVPVSAVNNPNAKLVIAAGSEIDLSVLNRELSELDAAGYNATARLLVDNQATILSPQYIEDEVNDGIQERLGSTAKGIGAARADRIWRYADLWHHAVQAEQTGDLAGFDTADVIRQCLKDGATVMIEGTQGYGLGLHAGMYPKCTSSDCRAIDFLSMAGVSPWDPAVGEFEVWLATRVRPIRVAGNSGALKGETTWDDLGLPREYTTVTLKERRVGEWDGDLVRRAVAANGGAPTVRLALTMVDSVIPDLSGMSGVGLTDADIEADGWQDLANLLKRVEGDSRARVAFVATGPTTGIWR